MTVGDVLRQLGDMPKDTTVVVNMSKNELANGAEVNTLALVLACRHKGSGNGVWNEEYYPDLPEDEDYEYRVVLNITP